MQLVILLVILVIQLIFIFQKKNGRLTLRVKHKTKNTLEDDQKAAANKNVS